MGDSKKDKLKKCDSETGVSKPASKAPSATLAKYLDVDKPIRGTPTVHINGKNVKTSYSAIANALCSADPFLSRCSSAVPNGADEKIQQFCGKPANLLV